MHQHLRKRVPVPKDGSVRLDVVRLAIGRLFNACREQAACGVPPVKSEGGQDAVNRGARRARAYDLARGELREQCLHLRPAAVDRTPPQRGGGDEAVQGIVEGDRRCDAEGGIPYEGWLECSWREEAWCEALWRIRGACPLGECVEERRPWEGLISWCGARQVEDCVAHLAWLARLARLAYRLAYVHIAAGPLRITAAA